MKKRSILILLFLLILLFEENHVFSQKPSLSYEYYTQSSISNRNYDYELLNRKKALESIAADIHRGGLLSSFGVATGVAAVIGISLKEFSLGLSIPLGIVAGGGAGVGTYFLFNYWGEQVYKKSTAIEVSSQEDDFSNISSSYLNYMLGTYEYNYTTNSSEYADCLMWCGMMCLEAGDNMQAKEAMNESCRIFKEYGHGPFEGRDTINEILYLDLRSKLAYNGDIYYEAIHYSEASCELKRDFFGETSEVYLKSLLDLSRLHTERLNYRDAQKYHNLGYNAYVALIKKEFCEKSESERTTYWASVKDYIGKTLEIASLSAGSSRRLDSINAAAYNALLLSKGLLLNTTVSFENFVIESNNKKAIDLLNQKKQAFAQGTDQATLDAFDYAILNALKASGQEFNLPHLSINWKNIRQKLGPDDLAIEFFGNADGTYGALLLRKQWKAPKIVLLNAFIPVAGHTEYLGSMLQHDIFESFKKEDAERLWALSKAIWCDDIIKHFPTTEQGRVFFAAADELLVTGIEYLPFVKPEYNGDKVVTYHCISDLYNIYRVTSTRELVTGYNAADSIAAIYGGLLYDLDTNDPTIEGRNRETRSAEQPIPVLKGTQIEADSIIHIINKSKTKAFKATPYMGAEGTEASFKALSGTHPRIIHVGTHGFFYSAADSIMIQRFNLGDNPLSHTGLFLAGADNKWFGDPIPEGQEDGFLTALEISTLDLRGLDLVVLSACETGKGEIHSDGVFGLQRGFKMAGANSIFMSLWKVDDDATCTLMTSFYKNWMEGKSKHDAFEIAKQTVRSHTEKGWDDPKYWAAFILLDAI